MFHNILLPTWLKFFFPLKAIAFGNLSGPAQRNLIKQLCLRQRPRQSELFCLYQATLPMGFKWAVELAHSIASAIIDQSTRLVDPILPLSTVKYKRISRDIRHEKLERGDALILHIIDDINVVGVDLSNCIMMEIQASLVRNLEASALPLKLKTCTPIGEIDYQGVPFIGYYWDFSTGLLRPKDDRIEAVSTLSHISLRFLNELDGANFQRLVGKVVWTALARRSLLSVLRCAFHPHAHVTGRARKIASTEIRRIANLCHYAFVQPTRAFSNIVLNTDASLKRGSVMWSLATSNELAELSRESCYVGGELPDSKPVCEFVKTRRWRLVFNPKWKRPAHINELEALIILLSIRWLLAKQVQNVRVVVLSDSFVVLGVIAKGRSSRPTMLRFARMLAALVLAVNLEIVPVHVPTKINPADGPSRA